MHGSLKAVAGALLVLAGTLGAQGSQTPGAPQVADTLFGTISTMLPSGAVLRGTGATVYLWADVPDLRTSLDAACIAAHAQPNAWLTARTELESPSGLPVDSVTAADLAILQRIVATPHAEAHADSSGHFIFIEVPAGTFWVEAEMMQGSHIVQWWHRLSMEPVDFAFTRLLGQKTSRMGVELATQDFTHDQFCTGGEQPLGATEFAMGRKPHVMSSTPSDSAYLTEDEPVRPLDELSPDYPAELRQQKVEGSVTVRFVVNTSGAVDMRTLHIVSSSDFRFANAVRDLLPRKHYQPARIDGHPVRGVVEQQFNWSLRQ